MARSNIVRVTLMNMLSSLVIAVITVNILIAFGLKGGVYLGNLFGLYFLVIYGMNNLVQVNEIPNNYIKFVYIIFEIIVFDILFLLIIPLLFGQTVFPPTEYIRIDYNGVLFNWALSKEFYLALFAVIMLIMNFIIYRRKNEEIYGE